jgi:hypothetical protein
MIALSIVFGILICVLTVYVCCQTLCKEPTPEEKERARQPRYGTILDKDPELRQDHLKYEAHTIGLND